MNPLHKHEFAAAIVARIGMTDVDRLILGAALICEVAENSRLFPNIKPDDAEPFKTAIAVLTELDSNSSAPLTAAIIGESQ